MTSFQIVRRRLSKLTSQSNLWPMLMVGLALVSALIYFHGFRGLLPYHLDPDEPVFFLSAAEIRTTGRVQLNPFYPPLRFYEMAVEQTWADLLAGGRAAQIVYGVFARVVSGYAALLLLGVIYRIGCEVHSPLAGLLAAGLLAFDSQLVRFAHVARGDTINWLLGAAVILGTARLLRQNSWQMWVITIVCGIGAFLAKYSIAPILLLPGYLILARIIRRPALQLAFVGTNLLLALGGIFYVRAHANLWQDTLHRMGFLFLFNPEFPFLKNGLATWRVIQSGLGAGWLVIGLALLPLLIIWGRSRFTRSQLTLLGLLAGAVAGAALVFTLTIARYHDAYVVVLAWAIFGGVALGLLAEHGRWRGLAAALGLVVFLTGPRVRGAWKFGEEQTRPHTLAALGNWFIANVPQGARTVVELHTPFNSYAGFPGRQIYHQFVVDSIFAESVDEYRKRGYEYLIWISKEANDSGFADLASPEKQQLLQGTKEILRLAGDEFRGDRIVVYQIPPLQQQARYLWFGSAISFRGFDLNSDTFKPGDDLQLMLYWMSAEKTPANYIIFVHMLAADGKTLLVGQDGPPDHGNRPTWSWAGDMQLITDPHILTIPADAPPGAYILRAGMYDADTSQRLQVFDLQHQPVGDNVVLAEIHIQK